MRTIKLLVLLIFLTSLTFAQNTATVSSEGDRNRVEVNQSGNNISADVSQTGDDNTAGLLQSGTGLVEADVDQSGNTNQADVHQHASSGHTFTLIRVIGDDNTTNVEQGANSTSSQEQTGNYNTADVAQGGSGSQLSEAQQTQSGHHNRAAIDQDWAPKGHAARQEQSGSHNESYITQRQGYNTARNDALVHQLGNDNYAEVEQTFGGVQSATGPEDMINKVVLEQMDDDNRAWIRQVGDKNQVNLHQRDNSYADIDQQGLNNVIQGVNGDPFARQYDGSIMTAGQLGNGNVLNAYQDSGSSATIMSQGNQNQVILYQTGAAHSINVSQTGNDQLTEIIQTP